jgi:hypothetical protein
MLRRFFQSRVFSKLFYELLPAAAVSILGAFLINKYARPTDPPPRPVATAAANAELVLLLREQQALLAEYLKKTAEARQRAGAGVAAVPEAETLKAAERTAAQVLRESKAAEARALAAARAGTEAPERKVVVRQPVQQPAPSPPGEPLHLHPAASTAPPPPAPQIAAPAMPPAPPRENAAVSTLRDAMSAIERIPSRITDWFSEGAPPRPPADLPQRNFMKVAL